jgi:hypothetical protein
VGRSHAGSLESVTDEVLACTLDRTGRDRPAVGEVGVVAHPLAVAFEVGGDVQSVFAMVAVLALGDDQLQALDDLVVDLAFEDPLRALVDERLGLGAALAAEPVRELHSFSATCR